MKDKYLAADGIENAIQVLEEIEDDKLNHLDFVELSACPGGCVGGVMNVENPFVARAKIQALRKFLPVSLNRYDSRVEDYSQYCWTTPVEYLPAFRLDEDTGKALEKLRLIEKINASLPGLDCGLCGAPSCRAYAEDIVNGRVTTERCVRRYPREDPLGLRVRDETGDRKTDN